MYRRKVLRIYDGHVTVLHLFLVRLSSSRNHPRGQQTCPDKAGAHYADNRQPYPPIESAHYVSPFGNRVFRTFEIVAKLVKSPGAHRSDDEDYRRTQIVGQLPTAIAADLSTDIRDRKIVISGAGGENHELQSIAQQSRRTVRMGRTLRCQNASERQHMGSASHRQQWLNRV